MHSGLPSRLDQEDMERRELSVSMPVDSVNSRLRDRPRAQNKHHDGQSMRVEANKKKRIKRKKHQKKCNKKLKEDSQYKRDEHFISLSINPSPMVPYHYQHWNQSIQIDVHKQKLNKRLNKMEEPKIGVQQAKISTTSLCSKDILRFFTTIIIWNIYEVLLNDGKKIKAMDCQKQSQLFGKIRNLKRFLYKNKSKRKSVGCELFRQLLHFKFTDLQWNQILDYQRVYDKIYHSFQKGKISQRLGLQYVCFIPNLQKIRGRQKNEYVNVWGDTRRSYKKASQVMQKIGRASRDFFHNSEEF